MLKRKKISQGTIVMFILVSLLLQLIQPSQTYAATEEDTETPVISIEEMSIDISMAEGNHAKWIDRLDLPDYALNFYKTLEKNTAGDGFLVNPEQEKYACTVKSSSGDYIFYGLKVAETEYNDIELYDDAAESRMKRCIPLVYLTFLIDHPEVFWLSGEYGCSILTSKITDGQKVQKKISFYFVLKDADFDIRKESYRDLSILNADITKRDEKISEALAGAAGYTTDAQKAEYFNDWLTYRNEYNTMVASGTSGAAPDECYGCLCALVGSTGAYGPVCEGYSKAFQVLCNQAGIPCILSMGQENTQAHMWNLIQLDGAWYGVDVTWNDPVSDYAGAERHTYLFAGTTTIVDGVTFQSSRETVNSISSNDALCLTNEPVLSQNAYDATILSTENVLTGTEGYAMGSHSTDGGGTTSGNNVSGNGSAGIGNISIGNNGTTSTGNGATGTGANGTANGATASTGSNGTTGTGNNGTGTVSTGNNGTGASATANGTGTTATANNGTGTTATANNGTGTTATANNGTGTTATASNGSGAASSNTDTLANDEEDEEDAEDNEEDEDTLSVENETGNVFIYKGLMYRITAEATGTSGRAEVIGAATASLKKVTCPAVIKAISREDSTKVQYRITSIGKNAFQGNKKLVQVTLGKNIKKIGKKAFFKCTKMKKLTILSKQLKASSIGKKAFAGTQKAVTVKAPAGKKQQYNTILSKKGLKIA